MEIRILHNLIRARKEAQIENYSEFVRMKMQDSVLREPRLNATKGVKDTLKIY